VCNAGDGNTETYYQPHVKKQPMDLVKRTKQEEKEEDEEDQRAMVATGKSGVHLRDSRVVTKKRGMSTLVQPTNRNYDLDSEEEEEEEEEDDDDEEDENKHKKAAG